MSPDAAIDLRSDTVTRPTPAMKQAMVDAPLGDDVLGDDPTVRRLEAVAAERAGKEAAVFVPSGTMANLIAIRTHTQPGDEVLMYEGGHPFNYEAGGAAAFAGVQIRPLPAARGLLSPETVEGALRPDDVHFAPARLLCVEDTSNRGGGTVYPMERLAALTSLARHRGLGTHLDGARVFDAVVASGVPLDQRASGFDTVSFCFSKGLGAPVGSVLCGSRDRMALARRVRKALGGGMRQSGMLAAAALYALEHHVQRLSVDHARARELAMGLMIDGLSVDTPQTNMVYVEVPDAAAWQGALEQQGIRCLSVSPTRLRLVLHLDVPDDVVRRVLAAFSRTRDAIAQARPA